MLAAAAASAATAVATVQSATEERLRETMLTAERERARWARELHDSVLQGIGSRRMLLSSALKSGDRGRLETAVAEALGDMARDIADLRALIAELRPATLDQLGLVAALEDLTERMGHSTGFVLDVELGIDAERLDAELETAVYRLVQEALNNVVKHAGAERVQLDVRAGESQLAVLVVDDGAGFDPTAERDGFGLAGMRERVELAGGELQIESRPGRGTRVMASLPLAATPGSGLDQAAGEGAADQLGAG
jgi:signal transduction histidine kinase